MKLQTTERVAGTGASAQPASRTNVCCADEFVYRLTHLYSGKVDASQKQAPTKSPCDTSSNSATRAMKRCDPSCRSK